MSVDGSRAALERIESFDEVVRSQQARVCRALLRFGVPQRDLMDAAQDVFMVVHRRLPEFEARSSVSTWVYRIAMHVASSYRRGQRRRREAPSEDATVDACVENRDEVETRDLLANVARAIDALEPDKREVFILYELEELSMPEIASRLRVPLKTGFSRLYAARRALFSLLRARGLSLWSIAWPVRLGDEWLTPATKLATSSAAPPWLAMQGASAVAALALLTSMPNAPDVAAPAQAPRTETADAAHAELPALRAMPSTIHDETSANAPPAEAPTVAYTTTTTRRRPATPPSATPRTLTHAPRLDTTAPTAEPQVLEIFYDSSEPLRPRVLPPLAIPVVHEGSPLPRIVVRGELTGVLAKRSAD